MHQLGPTDAVFLAMETDASPSHVGGLAILDPTTAPDGAFDYARFVEFLESRIALCPRFTWRVQEVPFGLDRPYWVETEDFDPGDLVHRVAVPAPGGREELAELTGLLFPRPLDRSKPLWEMYFIEGLQGGRVALLWKVHHALMDGGAGAGIAELMFDLGPEPADRPLVPVDDDCEAGAPATPLEMLGGAIRNGVARPRAAARHLGKALGVAAEMLFDSSEGDSTSVPHTMLNGPITAERAIAWSSVSLDAAKAAKNTLGVKLNDVVLGITGGAVREYLADHDDLPEASLVAAVPVSTREKGDKRAGNQITQVGVYWGTDLEDPVERVEAISEASRLAKESVGEGRNIDPIAIFAEALTPGAVQLLMRGAALAADSMPIPSNAVVSNVAMAPFPMYIAGARIADVVPVSVLAPTCALNITVISYDDRLHFGLTADPTLVPDVGAIAGAIPKALLALQAAIDGAEAQSA